MALTRSRAGESEVPRVGLREALDQSGVAAAAEAVDPRTGRAKAFAVPVVFLVLPVTVLFALFPGLISIVSLAQTTADPMEGLQMRAFAY